MVFHWNDTLGFLQHGAGHSSPITPLWSRVRVSEVDAVFSWVWVQRSLFSLLQNALSWAGLRCSFGFEHWPWAKCAGMTPPVLNVLRLWIIFFSVRGWTPNSSLSHGCNLILLNILCKKQGGMSYHPHELFFLASILSNDTAIKVIYLQRFYFPDTEASVILVTIGFWSQLVFTQ